MNAVADIRYLSQPAFEQLETPFDEEYGIQWAKMNPRSSPTFNPQILIEVQNFIQRLVSSKGTATVKGADIPINYVVLSSKVPGIFSLGGDLALFRSAIGNRDRQQLLHYGRLCIDDLLPWNRNFDLPITTISLVQGTALGGGFEGALASSVVIAEESSRMGFPEVLFNLFPGMGAYSFLSRKVGRRVTDELVTSGNTYSARQLFDMGVVDVVAGDGEGEAAVYSYVRKHARNGKGRRAIEQLRRDYDPVTREELTRIVDLWVDTALNLDERDLKMMDRLVRAQLRAAQENAAANIAQPVLGLSLAAGD